MAKKRVRDKEQKIAKIIQTFLNLIEKNGYDKVSTNHIADKARVAIGTIYKYFPKGKIDILKTMFKMGIERKMNDEIIPRLEILNIDELRESEYYRNLLLHIIDEHHKGKFIVKAIESECLVNKSFYSELRELLLIETNKDFDLIEYFLPDAEKYIEDHEKKIYRISRLKELLIHRHILFPDLFESDEECANIIIELVIALIKYYLRK